MAYSFIEIEKQKSWIIKLSFIFLIMFYFLVAEALWLVTKLFFIFEARIAGPILLFSLGEALIVLLIALIVAFIHWHFSTRDMINRILNLLGAIEIDPKDSYHQVFKNVVEEVCVAIGRRKIDCRVVNSSSLNAFAVADFADNAVIGVTEALLAKLNRSQLEAVVGHEAAHIASGDSLITTVVSSLFGVYNALLEGIGKTINRVSHGRRTGGVVLYLVIIYIVLSITQVISFLLNMFISRQKECRADAVAIRLTRNPISLAESLYIISRGWRGIGEISNSLSPIFLMSPDYNELEEQEGFISNLLSTHPPIKNRLAILMNMAHSDISSLKESIKPKQRIPVEEGVVKIKQEPNREWLIYKDSSWQGPFAIEELFNLGLNPNSWVSKLDERNIKQALDDEVLNKALRERITGKVLTEKNACPECNEPLSEVLYEGAVVFKCYYCEGILTSKDVVFRIMVREDFTFPSSIVKYAEAVLESQTRGINRNRFKVAYVLICPKCKNKMWRGFFSYAFPIEIDRCEQCQYIWFNKDELEVLQCLSEKFRLEKPR